MLVQAAEPNEHALLHNLHILEARCKRASKQSSNLPFGQAVSFKSLSGPSYVTTQTLIEHVAYTLSDRLWTYSPETFDLDAAVKHWSAEGAEKESRGCAKVEPMQLRHGAASAVLGYMFAEDFNSKKRRVPQSILAPAASLCYLRDSLEQLSRLYASASPFVAHVAAVDYAGGPTAAFVADYASIMLLAEELGFGLVSSFSAHEAQHMSLFATLLANVIPSIHTYDGISVGRETTRVVDVISDSGLDYTYNAILNGFTKLDKRGPDIHTQLFRLLEVFNQELGTTYDLFEYHGHASPDSVVVAFGTVESSLVSQVALSMQKTGAKVGALNVRVYRPFLEAEFLRVLPTSVKAVGVLGQVHDHEAVSDISVQSCLYRDVLAAVVFSNAWVRFPSVVDVKYPREQVWSPASITAIFQSLSPKPLLKQDENARNLQDLSSLQLIDPSNISQCIFWDIDGSPSASVSTTLSQALASHPASNITVRTYHDNLLQGGVRKTEIRQSRKTIEAAFAIDGADLIYIGAEILTETIDVVHGLKQGGHVVIKLPGFKDDALETRLNSRFRKALGVKSAQLCVLDPVEVKLVADNSALEAYLVQVALLRVGFSGFQNIDDQVLASVNELSGHMPKITEDVEKAVHRVEIPKAWAAEDLDVDMPPLRREVSANSFAPFEHQGADSLSAMQDWKSVAKGFAFKEVYQTEASLRPDVSVKTYTVHVKDNYRLTPLDYERNIFHIEFDLGESGLRYEIGEALGIHAENNENEVRDFIKFYTLNAEDIVQMPSRVNPDVLQNRTVLQALLQDIDIFGRPPKRFYEALSEFATDPKEKKELLVLGGPAGATEFKRRAEVDTITYADVLLEFSSAHPDFQDIVRIVNPMKRREYSIASCQKTTPRSVALMVVVVGWQDPKGRARFGQATWFLSQLRPGAAVTVSVKPSVMKLPPDYRQPVIMAGLGTGLAPFRAFVQHRALEKEQGKEIGAVILYMGSRHQRQEYCYGEEWEAYQAAGVITLLGRAFSRDQPQKIYIQDRMRETMDDIIQAYLKENGAFYLCGPTWPVPDVTSVLQDAIAKHAQAEGKRLDPPREIERLKDQGRYVLEVY